MDAKSRPAREITLRAAGRRLDILNATTDGSPVSDGNWAVLAQGLFPETAKLIAEAVDRDRLSRLGDQQELPVIKAHDKRHGGVLRIDMPVVGESSFAERAEICLIALAMSEGRGACDDEKNCRFPRCIPEGCPGGKA